jgi:hypothetical protein
VTAILLCKVLLTSLIRDSLSLFKLSLVVPRSTSKVVQCVGLELWFRCQLQTISVEVLSRQEIAFQEVDILKI